MNRFKDKTFWGPAPNYPMVLRYKRQCSKHPITILGPCSIESESQIKEMVPCLASMRQRITYMRGGVYRAGTYPPKDPGLRLDLLKLWAEEAHKAGLKIIVEVLDIRQIDTIGRYADAFQVGARHQQDYALLMELAKTGKVVALKRHPGSTLHEFLGSAEYLMRGGRKPILIERGSSTHMNHCRWELSISLIAAVKRMTGLPILVDASHGTGRRDLVEQMTLAGIAAGADGFLVETHPKPEQSLSDADQAFPVFCLDSLLDRVERILLARSRPIRQW